MMYFRKINLNFEEIDYESNKWKHLVSFRELSYYELTPPIRQRIIKLLPSQLQGNCGVTFVQTKSGASGTEPHIDNGINVAINHYLEPADGVTAFFEPVDVNTYSNTLVLKSDVVKHLSGKVFSFNNVLLKDYFKATAGDTYLFNSSKIHSITSIHPNKIRKFIQISFSNHYFADVINLFK